MSKNETQITATKHFDQFVAMLEEAEIEFEQNSGNGITTDLELPESGMILHFGDDGELIGIASNA